MMTITIRQSTPKDSQDIIKLWHNTVQATHHFLSKQDFKLTHQDVSSLIPKISIILATNSKYEILDFIILSNNHIEALFIKNTLRRQGIGKKLIDHALTQYNNLTTTVNDQNTQARSFL